jgi:hypothetical protein
MVSLVLSSLFGILIFLFLFWRRLKEDYSSEKIFSSAFYILIGLVLGNIISFFIDSSFWFWFVLFGIFIGFLISIWSLKFKIIETIEAVGVAFLPWLSLIFLNDAFSNSNTPSLFASVFIIGLIVLFFVLDKRYKSFSWYKSGKVGFSGLFVLGIFFLARTAIAPIFSFMLSFAEKYEAFLSGLIAFLCFLLIFNLSREV